MYRYNPSIPVPYDRQGYIYFWTKNLQDRERPWVRGVCQKIGGDYGSALFEYETTCASADYISTKHYISCATLYRLHRKFYVKLADLVDR